MLPIRTRPNPCTLFVNGDLPKAFCAKISCRRVDGKFWLDLLAKTGSDAWIIGGGN